MRGLHPAAAWTWVQARPSARLRLEVKFVGFTPSFVRFVTGEGVFASASAYPEWRMNDESFQIIRPYPDDAGPSDGYEHHLCPRADRFHRLLRFNLGALPTHLAAVWFGRRAASPWGRWLI